MKKNYLFYLLVFIVSISNVNSQCLTDEYYQKAIKQNPNIVNDANNFFSQLNPIGQKRATKYIIPVVFHVIHTNGPENISLEQIEDQMRILNEDFSLTNANKSAIRTPFVNVAADCEFEFRLAKVDPQGNCTNGVNRIFNAAHVEARDNVKFLPGASWNNRYYLNIWIVSSIETSGEGTTLGYAYLPYSSNINNFSTLDGIVMRSDYVGTIGTGSVSGAGRTLTHEVGHYLGLLHTFQDGCNGAGANAGDRCGDTPPVAGTFTNANCPANNNSCTNDNPNLIDQWENYMDYSRGTCQSMFSQNQKTIMHNVMENFSFRKNLSSSNNLILTGINNANSAPIAFFNSTKRTVCVNENIQFFDNSCKAQVTSRQWTFTGANTLGTNIQNPVVKYSKPGKYKVSLMVGNSSGNNTLAVEEYITVLPSVALDKPSVRQDFESSTWNAGTGWSILDQGTLKFSQETTTGFSGTNSLVAPIRNGSPVGQRFQIITPSVDLRPTAGRNPKLSMMIGYLRQSASSSEGIRLYFSRNCDNSWTQFLYRNAFTLAYESTNYQTGFKPSASNHWKLLSQSLNQFQNDSNVQFMIEVESGAGNNVYIDDINIGIYNTNISLIDQMIQLNVYPNPSQEEINIDYENINGETAVWLENIEGKKIAEILPLTTQTGKIELKFRKGDNINNGIYLLKIKSNEQIVNKKVIFAN